MPRSLSPSKRWRVYVRDRFTCQACGQIFPLPTRNLGPGYVIPGPVYRNKKGEQKRLDLVVDHVIPVHHGGTNEIENLQALCSLCNGRKGARVDG